MKSLGNDIIEIERIKKAYERHPKHFLNKIFTDKEQQYCFQFKDPSSRLAGRFAAKEATVKALGVGFRDNISWLDIEILNDPLGKPYIHLSDSLKKHFNNPQILISISHCKSYAMATAILL